MNNVVILLVSLAVVLVTLGVMWRLGKWPFAKREPFGQGGTGNATPMFVKSLISMAESLATQRNSKTISEYQTRVGEDIATTIDNLRSKMKGDVGAAEDESASARDLAQQAAIVIGLLSKAKTMMEVADARLGTNQRVVDATFEQAIRKAITMLRDGTAPAQVVRDPKTIWMDVRK